MYSFVISGDGARPRDIVFEADLEVEGRCWVAVGSGKEVHQGAGGSERKAVERTRNCEWLHTWVRRKGKKNGGGNSLCIGIQGQ